MSVLQTEVSYQQQRQRQQLDDGLRRVFEAGQGCMTLTVVGERLVPVIVIAMQQGDAYARAVLVAAGKLLRKIDRRSHANAFPCALCAGVMWRGAGPGAVAVLTAYGVIPVRAAVGMAICADCAADRAEIELATMMVTAFRAGPMPDLRILPAFAEGGHA